MRCSVAMLWLVLGSLLPAQGASPPQAPSNKQQPQSQNAPASHSGAESPSTKKIDPVKEADIRRLLEITGAGALVDEMMGPATNNVKPLMTNSLPPGEYREKLVDLFFEKFRAKADKKGLTDLIVPIYDKYLSDDDVKGLIQFYSTPLGQKAVAVLPKLGIEAQEAGRQWGENLGRQAFLEVLAEHPDLAKAMQEAAAGAPPKQ